MSGFCTVQLAMGLTHSLSHSRYWITERRCEKTLQHLPARAAKRITLLKWDEHPILSKIGSYRLTIKFQKHPYAILVRRITNQSARFIQMSHIFLYSDCGVQRERRISN